MPRSFLLLWTGHAISEFGSAISVLALPLVAVTMLNATAFETGLLAAAGTVGWLFVSLPAGAVVDRLRKRPLMIACDIARAVLLGLVAIMALSGDLRLWQLYVIALLTGVLTVFYEVACWSIVPLLLPVDRLVAGHSRLGITTALADVGGQSAAGLLTAVLGNAARAVFADALSYVVNVFVLLRIRITEPVRERAPQRDLAAEIREGLAFVLRHPVLKRIVLTSATSGIFRGVTYALLVVYLVRDLDASASIIGLLLGMRGAGGVLGSMAVQGLAKRYGSARILWLTPLTLGAFALLIPLARPGLAISLVALGVFADGAASIVYNILQISYRQSICPPELRGRMNASVRWLIRGGYPAGAILGGTLATVIGIREVLLLGTAGIWTSIFWVIRSPLRLYRDIPLAHAGSNAS